MKFLCCFLLACMSVRGQAVIREPAPNVPVAPSWVPRPYFLCWPSFVGNGYQTFAANAAGGFVLRSNVLVADVEAGYMNARKVDDGTWRNNSGHERFLKGRLFYPWRRSFYFGAGAQWSQTSTTNYTKSAWRPTLGVGGDHFADDVSARWQVMYVTPGTDHWNALQGPEFQLWIPSPAAKSHFIWRMTLGIYEFHTTVTDPSDRKLTSRQIGERHSAGFVDFAIGWRF